MNFNGGTWKKENSISWSVSLIFLVLSCFTENWLISSLWLPKTQFVALLRAWLLYTPPYQTRNSHCPALFILCLQVVVRGAKSNPTNWWFLHINAGEEVFNKTEIWDTWKQNGKFWESKAGKYARQILGLLQTLAHFPYFREAVQGCWMHRQKMSGSAVLQERGEAFFKANLETWVFSLFPSNHKVMPGEQIRSTGFIPTHWKSLCPFFHARMLTNALGMVLSEAKWQLLISNIFSTFLTYFHTCLGKSLVFI